MTWPERLQALPHSCQAVMRKSEIEPGSAFTALRHSGNGYGIQYIRYC